MPRSAYVAAALVIAGVVLMPASFFWNSVVRTEWLWPEEASREYSEAVAALHSLPDHYELHGEETTQAHSGHSASHPSEQAPSEADEERQAIVNRFYKAQQQLSRARQVRQSGSRVVLVAGAIATMVGVAWLLVIRQREES